MAVEPTPPTASHSYDRLAAVLYETVKKQQAAMASQQARIGDVVQRLERHEGGRDN